MDNKALAPIMIAAGGTGGHVYPGIAVARQLIQEGYPVVWIGTKKGLEARVIPEAGIAMDCLQINGVRGKGVITLLAAPIKIIRALFQARKIISKNNPALVLGMGGFVAGPGCLMAKLMGKPVVIHEQNAIAGLTNKLLSNVATKILLGFPSNFNNMKKVEFIGNPVRADIKALNEVKPSFQEKTINVFIFGGSLGAAILNKTAPLAFNLLQDDDKGQGHIKTKINIRHQTGKNKDIETQGLYAQLNIEAEVTPFIEDMAEAYDWADIVICRSGALTIAELAAAGKASILVPYPYAVDDHQTANARFLTDEEAAILLPENKLSETVLAEKLSQLIDDKDVLLKMSEKTKALAKLNATERVTEICIELAGYNNKRAIGAETAVGENK